MDFRRLLGGLHRYAGLGIALFVVALGASGALMALEGLLLPSSFVGDRYTLEPGEDRVPVDTVLHSLERQYLELPSQVNMRGGAGRPDEYRFAQRRTVFVNPYSGEILGEAPDFRTTFSRALWTFHATVLLGTPGRWLVGVATAVLAVSMLFGLGLSAYSLNRGGWRMLSLRWTGNARAWNIRFHNAMGMAFSPVLLAIGLSGCFMAFEPVERATLKWLDAGAGLEAATPRIVGTPAAGRASADEVLRAAGAMQRIYTAERIWLRLPGADQPWRVQITEGGGGRGARETVFVDPYTGERLSDPYAAERTRTETTRWLIRSFHYGTFAGTGAVLLWALACLMLVAFAISGVYIWLGKRRTWRRTSRAGRGAVPVPP